MAISQLVSGLLRQSGLLAMARDVRAQIIPARRIAWRRRADEVRALTHKLGANYTSLLASYPTSRRVLITGMGDVTSIAFQAPLVNAFRLAGFRPTVVSGSSDAQLQAAYKLFGVEHFVHYEDKRASSLHPEARTLATGICNADDLMKLSYRDIPVGKYALSTAMRRARNGDPMIDAATVEPLLDEVLRDTDAALAIVDEVKPHATLCLDHGYTPDGQLFDATLMADATCFTWNAAHRDGALMLKRYDRGGKEPHPSSLSVASWAHMRSMNWTSVHWDALNDEIEGCYARGEWYGEVGTQFNRRLVSSDDLRVRLGIRPGRKVAAIFPHIFWDATFFWGTDLFRNYEAWFVAALRAACENDQVDWIVKVHPGNIVKDRRDGHLGEHSEIVAIRLAVGDLPQHIKLIQADSDISTYALYDLVDYCLTVRGTVGIEAACFGIPVLTAGTGRYDGLGFTIDSTSTGEYLDRLKNIEAIPRMSEAAIELARRYAYGIFLARPTPLRSIRFAYSKDDTASLCVEIGSTDPFAPDVAAIANWIGSSAEDFITQVPSRGDAQP